MVYWQVTRLTLELLALVLLQELAPLKKAAAVAQTLELSALLHSREVKAWTSQSLALAH